MDKAPSTLRTKLQATRSRSFRTARHPICLISGNYQRCACIVAPLFQEVLMRTRSRVIGGVLAVSLFTQLTACGTLFYPDRRGQIDGKIDPAIAVANAVGLLFYVIPGLIAFGIDFATGAIYLPDVEYSIAPEKLQEAIGADGVINQDKKIGRAQCRESECQYVEIQGVG